MATTDAISTAGDTTAAADPTVGLQTGTESSLSNWAGDYVTDMLGRGWAMADEGYQSYTGPLTAGESNLQSQAFQGLANLAMPTMDQMTFTPGSFTDQGVAQQYMNPYIDQALQPQLDEVRRQAQLQQNLNNAEFAKAGAYGGSRQAVMEAENQRNMMQQMANIIGQGYQNAYTQGANQFNTEQGLGLNAATQTGQFGLAGLNALSNLGAQQRDIEQQGYTADYEQFQEERDFPYKQVQYMQSLLQGLPLAAQNYSYSEPSGLSTLLGTAGGIGDIATQLFGKDWMSSLKDYALNRNDNTGYYNDDNEWVAYDITQE